jgi:DNA-binding protein H-NS
MNAIRTTRISIREAVDILLEKAHELADRADAKRDMYLRGAVDTAIEQVHKVADVLESVEYQLTNEP